jgi:hypothetical protein
MSADEVAAEVTVRLEERSATWTRADVVEEVTRLVDGFDAASVRERVDKLADFVLGDAAILNLAGPLPDEERSVLLRRDGMRQTERHGARRFTTRTMLAREAAVLEFVDAGRNSNVANASSGSSPCRRSARISRKPCAASSPGANASRSLSDRPMPAAAREAETEPIAESLEAAT